MTSFQRAVLATTLSLAFGAAASADNIEAGEMEARAAFETPALETETLTARGVVEARHSAALAAPMSRRLTRVPYRTGTSFKAGAILAAFDCTSLEAERDARADALQTLSLRETNQRELFAMGATGELDLKLAESEAAQAASELRALGAQLSDCTLTAPWAGSVVERHKEAHETPKPGEPIYTLLRAGRPEIVLIVPSAWSGWLERGSAFTFEVDETGEALSASVSRLGATVDPTSQTLEIAAKINEPTRARPGMSGTARFPRRED